MIITTSIAPWGPKIGALVAVGMDQLRVNRHVLSLVFIRTQRPDPIIERSEKQIT